MDHYDYIENHILPTQLILGVGSKLIIMLTELIVYLCEYGQ